jgi:hypothetical protein
MNNQEREHLNGFLQQLSHATAPHKDADADVLIRAAIERQPDAGYLLVQRVLLLERAVQTAQAETARLQAELDELRSTARGGYPADANAWGRFALMAAQAAPMTTRSDSTWGSGWLGNVATTAAGVVAGSFLFQGIEHLLGHNGGGWGAGAPALDGAADQTTINNYFDSSANPGGELDSDALDDSPGSDGWL